MEIHNVSIHNETFSVSAPYAEGQVITAIEAKVLNQTRAENIANNFRKRIKAALESVPMKEGGEIETLAAVREAFAKYDEEYTFAMPSVGREPLDPVEREARKMAKAGIVEKLKSEGRKLKDVDEKKLEAAIAKLAAREDIQKEAKRRVNSSRKAVENGLDDVEV